jgi:hypothetical protein
MEIKQIHLMQWGDEEKTVVRVVADTDRGNNEEIGTPYNAESIIWADVQAFPVEEIADYAPITEV